MKHLWLVLDHGKRAAQSRGNRLDDRLGPSVEGGLLHGRDQGRVALVAEMSRSLPSGEVAAACQKKDFKIIKGFNVLLIVIKLLCQVSIGFCLFKGRAVKDPHICNVIRSKLINR